LLTDEHRRLAIVQISGRLDLQNGVRLLRPILVRILQRGFPLGLDVTRRLGRAQRQGGKRGGGENNGITHGKLVDWNGARSLNRTLADASASRGAAGLRGGCCVAARWTA